MNVIVKAEAPLATASNALIPQNMDQAVKLAEMMAKGKMMPEHLRGSPGDCLMVIEQAMRWQMSPFAVAQCTSSIKGKLMFEGKLVAAAIEASGAIIGSFDYTFHGEKDQRKIIVSATRRGETVPRTVDVWWKDAKTTNDVWARQPDQQLVYHGTRVWGRRWTPGVILGVYSREEFNAAGEPFEGTTIEAHAEPAPPAPTTEKTPQQKFTEWLAKFKAEADTCGTQAEFEQMCGREEITRVTSRLKNGMKDEFDTAVGLTIDRLTGMDIVSQQMETG